MTNIASLIFFNRAKITGFRRLLQVSNISSRFITADKVFILLLVILLPLTGCIDMTDNAEGQVEPDSTTVVDSTEVSTLPTVYSLYLERGTVATLNFNGNETLKLETHFYNYSNPVESDRTAAAGFFTMNCDGVEMVDLGIMVQGHYLPVLAGQSCLVEITAGIHDSFYFFSKANLESIR